MSLRKSPTMTEARLEANRRSAKKSTGPRTAAGKARSRMNGFRHGMRSPEYVKLLTALCDAAPGAVLRAGERCLTAVQRTHPAYMELVELFKEVERQMMEPLYPVRQTVGWRGSLAKKVEERNHYDRSLNVI
jgi:hypothetical protein